MQRARLLRTVKTNLLAAFGDRLRGVVLYGSRARGDHDQDSDLDLLVLLAAPVRFGEDLEQAVRAVYPLQLEWGRPIHPQPVDERAFEAGEFGLYRNAKREGVFL